MKGKFSTLILFFVINFTISSKAQNYNSTIFLKDFNEIFEDAKRGFPNTTGVLTESIGWWGNTYKAKKNIFGESIISNLYYVKAHEPTKYVPEATPELFYFSQAFKEQEPSYRFIKDSLEILLDAKAKELGLTKKEIKQTKEYKKKHRKVEYQIGGKSVLGLFHSKESNEYDVMIYSPFRPGDVTAPKNRLGCVAFSYSGFDFIYVVTVYGEKMGNMSDIVQRAFNKSGLTDKNYIYSWYSKKSLDEVSIQLGKSKTVRDSGSITVD